MSNPIFVLNGPRLSIPGARETHIPGTETRVAAKS